MLVNIAPKLSDQILPWVLSDQIASCEKSTHSATPHQKEIEPTNQKCYECKKMLDIRSSQQNIIGRVVLNWQCLTLCDVGCHLWGLLVPDLMI